MLHLGKIPKMFLRNIQHFNINSAFSKIFAKFRQNVVKFWTKFNDIISNMGKIRRKMRKSLTIFFWNIEVWAVQKHVNLVDLGKSFPTNIFLQNLASIQKRTSLLKFLWMCLNLFFNSLWCEGFAIVCNCLQLFAIFCNLHTLKCGTGGERF